MMIDGLNKGVSGVPRVSIGLPVYNGEPFLAQALAALQAQTACDWELIISDNASTDRTGEIALEAVRQDPRLRYHRNPQNLGALANFLRVLELARGDYFMWAAHDDRWSEEYVARLAARLDADPLAVLATPQTTYIGADGQLDVVPPDRPAGGTSTIDNIRILLADNATSWIYGMYRTDWLRARAGGWRRYDPLGGDLLWLFEVALQHHVVGDPQAVIYKRWIVRQNFAPRSFVAKSLWRLEMAGGLASICWHYPRTAEERRVAVAAALGWYYGLCLRGRSRLRSTLRCLRYGLLDALVGPWYGLARLAGIRRIRC
jgi:glycosyltransferase involved in cell wall biosynthesis